MNVWRYIYIQFFKIRRRIIGNDGADEYAAMLFVTSLDCLFYFGVVTLTDGVTGYHLLPKHKLLYALLFIGGGLIIETIRNRTMCKKGVFERVRKEVEEEPRKFLWGTLYSIIRFSRSVFFCTIHVFMGKKTDTGLNFLTRVKISASASIFWGVYRCYFCRFR